MKKVSEKSKQNLKSWKPGQSGNPAGKRANPLTKDKVHATIGKFSELTLEEIKAIGLDPKSTILEVTVAAIFAEASRTGDYTRLEFLLTRSIGKVKEELEVAAVQPFLLRKRDGEVIEMGLEQKALPAKKEETDE